MSRRILQVVAALALATSLSACVAYPAGGGYRHHGGGYYNAPRPMAYAGGYGRGWGGGYRGGWGGGGWGHHGGWR